MRIKRYAEPADDRRRNGPVIEIRPKPGAWDEAKARANGDTRRLRPMPDGSVLVLNGGR